MKIGIIGGGNVGGALAKRLMEAGHAVQVGVPNPSSEKYAGLAATTPDAAADFGELVILAIPWKAAEEELNKLRSKLAGKVVIDCTNPIASDFSGLVTGHPDSGGQQVARWIPESKVVKAFNTIGFGIMANPDIHGSRATLLVAGDDATAKATVGSLGEEIGFTAVDVGPLHRSAQTEALAWLWIMLAVRDGTNFTFNLVRRGDLTDPAASPT